MLKTPFKQLLVFYRTQKRAAEIFSTERSQEKKALGSLKNISDHIQEPSIQI